MSDIPETTPVDSETDDAEVDAISHRGKRWNILSILSFIAALAVSPLAMPFGYVALRQIRKSDQSGSTLAWISVGLGWLWLASYAVVITALLTIWAENPFWP